MIARALLSVYDKTGHRRVRARRCTSSACELVSSGGTAQAIAEAGIPVTDVAEVTGVPGDPRPPGGHAAPEGPRRHPRRPRRSRRTVADMDDVRHRAVRPRGVEPLPVRAADPSSRLIDIGGPAMVRAAAKNHACVAHRHRARRSTTPCSTSSRERRRARRRRRAARSRSRRSRAPPRTTPRSSRGSRTDDDAARSTSCSRSSAPTSSCATARTRTSTARATASRGTHELVGRRRAAQRPRARYLNLYDADAAWRLVHDLGDRPGGARSSSTPTRAASRSPTTSPTAYQRALECDERSAFGGIVALNRPVDAATVERMVAGPQADVVIAPGYEPGTIEALIAEAQEHPAARGAARPSRRRLDFRQISGGFLVQDAAPLRRRRATTGGSSPSAQPTDERVARRRAGVAHLRPREVERDRAGEGRPGRRHRRRPAEPGRVGRDRGEEGRRAGRGRRVRVSDAFYPFPDGIEAAAAAGVAVVVQPGGSMRDDEGHRPGRRARPRDGLHRRTALPALMEARTMTAKMMPGGPVADAVFADLVPRIEKLHRERPHARPRHASSSATTAPARATSA